MSERPAETPAGRLGDAVAPPRVEPADEPPADTGGREAEWTGGERDTTPATGHPGGPAVWRRAARDARVALARRGWGDAQWSYLFKHDTRYAAAEADPEGLSEANRHGRRREAEEVIGPIIKPPVWTWEVPVYFWVGGVASGASFVALACDVAGDGKSAAVARRVALAAVGPAPLLLVADLGRPGRFLNMLRIFKPRSPMNLGAWCLVAFSGTVTGAVVADLLDRRSTAKALGAATAALGGYLGSYTGVLLACTAVPLWARSRLFLGPIFVSTAAATGAAAVRLTLRVRGLPADHPTRHALGTIETGAMLAELGLSTVNERRLGQAGRPLHEGGSGRLFKAAKWTVRTGLTLRLARRRLGPHAHDAASVLYLAGGLLFRMAWISAGKASARDDDAVAAMHRGQVTRGDEPHSGPGQPRLTSRERPPASAVRAGLPRVWTEPVRRVSLLVEKVLTRA